MRGLRAVLVKDLKQFLSGVGLVAILLPLVLLVALRLGSGSLMRGAYIEPFPIAVRDQDDTFMSRSLINQMAQVELFSEVVHAGDDETDAELMDAGCAAVVTIPKDIFYTLYIMDSDPVQLALNADMPLEATLVRTVIGSVMEIISSDQAVGRAVFKFCYGELSEEQEQELWQENATKLLRDALSRQQVFENAAKLTDVEASTHRSLLACALSVLILFFPLAAVKTLPEELYTGILPRFLAAGGKLTAFFLSKFMSGLLLTLPALALLLVAFEPSAWLQTILLSGMLFIGAFGLFLFIAAWCKDAAKTQRWGNLILLVSLVLGGALYPIELLPDAVAALSSMTLPYYARLGLDAIGNGAGTLTLISLIWPVPLAGLVLGFLALAGFSYGRRIRKHSSTSYPKRDMISNEKADLDFARPRFYQRLRGRVLKLATWRFRTMSGGWVGAVGMLLCASLCGSIASYALSHDSPENLRLAVVMEEQTPLASELVERISQQEGISLVVTDSEEAHTLLSRGRVEGVLTIAAGYDDALEGDGGLPLSYEGAGASSTVQAAREIIAGQVIAQRAKVRGLKDAGERLGRELDSSEEEELLMMMDEEAKARGQLYEVTTFGFGHMSLYAALSPQSLGFAALAVMLTLLTWTAWTGHIDARRVESRMGALRHGLLLSYDADVLALFVAGLACGLCALLPDGWPDAWCLLALAAYTLCVAGLALFLSRVSSVGGRMDVLAPFIALISCLIGGCFGNLSEFSPTLSTLSLFTPQGLALRAEDGSLPALVALIILAAVLLVMGAPRRNITGRI